MATRRAGKGEQENGETKTKDGVEEMKGTSLTEEGQLRKTRQEHKAQTKKELKKRSDTLRWIAIVVILILAAVGLYYYFTYYHVDAPPRTQTKSKVARDNGAKGKEKTPAKKPPSDKAKKPDPKVTKGKANKQTEQGAKKSKPTPTTKGSTAKKAKETPRAKPSPAAKKPVKERKPRQTSINLNEIRLLRRPFSPADPDKPYSLDILAGDELLKDKKYTLALEHFNGIIKKFPQSPRSLYGKAVALVHLAEEKRSNKLMDSAIDFFYKAGMESSIAKEDIKVAALVELADRAKERGKMPLAVKALEKLNNLRSDDFYYTNQLALAYLSNGNKRKAKTLFKKSLQAFPDNYFAKAQLGYILYIEKRYEQALRHLLDGIREDESVRMNPKFYLYAGDTLVRLNRSDEAHALYGQAVSIGLFPSVWQRSIHNEANLRALPWWSVEDTGYRHDIDRIVKGIKDITREALALFDEDKTIFSTQDESSPHFILFQNGKKNVKNCMHARKTCALIESFPEAAGCKRGAVKFSALPPLSHIYPFVGPTNTRLQVVMALDMDSESGVSIRMAEETKILKAKQVAILDESFEQELWYTGSKPAVLLTVDMWHPDLSEERIKKLGPL